MELLYAKIKKEKSEQAIAEMYLYGTIGDKIDGDHFARELAYAAREVDVIHLRINSSGGSVIQGMSIVAAISSTEAEVVAMVDGVAASMAAVIAIACDRVVMCDYAKMMIHDPFFTTSSKLTSKQKKHLSAITDMIRAVTSRKGMEEEQVAELMDAETWLSAPEAFDLGFCDEITPTGKRAKLESLSPDDLMLIIANEYQPIKQKNNMTLTANAMSVLAIEANATEVEISAAIEKQHTLNAALEARATAAEARLAEIETAAEATAVAQDEALIEAAILDGRINADAKEQFKTLCAKDRAAARATLAAIPVRKTVASQIGGKEKDNELLVASWDALDRAGRLAELKSRYPDRYVELYNTKFKKL